LSMLSAKDISDIRRQEQLFFFPSQRLQRLQNLKTKLPFFKNSQEDLSNNEG